jgi:hypothetical protein
MQSFTTPTSSQRPTERSRNRKGQVRWSPITGVARFSSLTSHQRQHGSGSCPQRTTGTMSSCTAQRTCKHSARYEGRWSEHRRQTSRKHTPGGHANQSPSNVISAQVSDTCLPSCSLLSSAARWRMVRLTSLEQCGANEEALMSNIDSPAVGRHRVRLALRSARAAKQFTQGQVAQAMEWSLDRTRKNERPPVATGDRPRKSRPVDKQRGSHVKTKT